MINNLSTAIWDNDKRRGLTLKEQVEMFSERETAFYIGDWDGCARHDVFFLSFDEAGKLVLKIARKVRLTGEDTHLLLISDRGRDLSPFLRPSIRPSGVMFRPVRNKDLRDLLTEIASEIERLTQDEETGVFVFKSENVSYRIPFQNILFFERFDRKVRLHTVGQEICYNDTMKNLSEILPDYFVRCHNSFLVNTIKIEEMRGDEMELRLSGGYRIPYSRANKNALKQALSG